MHKNILFPIDLNHKASWQKALPDVRRLVDGTGTIHLLGIVHDIGSSMVASFLPKGYEKKALEQMKAALDDFVARELPGEKVETHVGYGHVAETILKAAKKYDADLIVICSHKPDELRSLLIGSQANSVVRHAPVSVLVVR